MLLLQGYPVLTLAEAWKENAQEVRSHLSEVGNRSRLFGEDKQVLSNTFDGMFRTLRELETLLSQAAAVADDNPELAQVRLDAATARLQALFVGLHVTTLRMNYLLLADTAENAGMVSTAWSDALTEVGRRTDPIMDSLKGFEPSRMERAAAVYGSGLAELDSWLPRYEATVRKGAAWSRRAIVIADTAAFTVSAYEAYQALGELGGGGGPDITFRFPGLVSVGANGAVAASAVTISADVLESIRRLIELGALSHGVLSAGLGRP